MVNLCLFDLVTYILNNPQFFKIPEYNYYDTKSKDNKQIEYNTYIKLSGLLIVILMSLEVYNKIFNIIAQHNGKSCKVKSYS